MVVKVGHTLVQASKISAGGMGVGKDDNKFAEGMVKSDGAVLDVCMLPDQIAYQLEVGWVCH